jgi:hypothetical protein
VLRRFFSPATIPASGRDLQHSQTQRWLGHNPPRGASHAFDEALEEDREFVSNLSCSWRHSISPVFW